MRAWPWLVGGGIAAYAWTRRRDPAPSTLRTVGAAPGSIGTPSAMPGRWVWPVPRWNGRAPIVSDGFTSPRSGYPLHGGVDVMFPRAAGDPYKVGTPNGSKLCVMPDGIHALAAADGVVWSASQTPQGLAVVIDHTPIKAATFYTHLEKLLVAPTMNAKAGERVRAGQPIGVIGASPLDGERLKHLHFELWLGGPSSRIDPQPLMRAWEVADESNELVRNGALTYRSVGSADEPYPDWVRALEGKAGVYVIRNAKTSRVFYVGSSIGQLYQALTRHFQTWRRLLWLGRHSQYSEGNDPGLTYPRDGVEVAVRITSPGKARDEQKRLIQRLAPRDNMIWQPTQLAS